MRNNASGRSKGLRKFIPQPDRFAERYGLFTLTARDVEILEVVHRYRYLEARHIRALVGGSDQQITRRLQGLFHNKYLGRYARRERMRIELDPGAPLIAYGLELKGARALERHRGGAAAVVGLAPEPVRWRKEYTRRMEWFLEHQLMIANFRCVLELALREAGEQRASLVTWNQSTAIRGTVKLRSGNILRVNPDAFFTIRDHDGVVRNYFLEFDSGSEEQHRIAAKFVAYWWWLQAPAYREAHVDHERVAVLFVTTGAKRKDNMMATLAGMQKPNNPAFGGRGWFRFCLESDYALADPRSVLGPVWLTLGPHNEPRPLF